jgi:hypothetical protein
MTQKIEILVAEVRKRLAGRKTYLLAALLVVTVLILVYAGQATPETILPVAMVFAGLISASFRSAIAQHQAEVLQALTAIATAGIDVRQGNKAAAVQVVEKAAAGPTVAEVLATINKMTSANPTVFHSGGDVPEGKS